eukprot:3509763-Amphidinium_carterae.1
MERQECRPSKKRNSVPETGLEWWKNIPTTAIDLPMPHVLVMGSYTHGRWMGHGFPNRGIVLPGANPFESDIFSHV